MKKSTVCILFICMFASTTRAGFMLDIEQGIPKSNKSEIQQELNKAKQNFYSQCGKTACIFITWAGIGISSYLISKLYQR